MVRKSSVRSGGSVLKASLVEIRLTPEELGEALRTLAAGRAGEMDVSCGAGALTIKVQVSVEAVRMTVPVTLRFTPRQILPESLLLEVEWTNMGALPWALKNMVLSRAFEQLPGRYEDGTLQLPVRELLDELPVEFTLDQVRIDPDGLTIRLRDAVLYPVAGGIVAEAAVLPAPSTGEAEPPEHQDFYRKLRERVRRYAAAKAPNWARPLLPWVLAVPDFFVLMVRLARDPRVPSRAKLLAGASVLYFLTPIDLIPDVIPLLGQVDDIALALFALESVVRSTPPGVVQELWPGEGDVLALIQSGVHVFTEALPRRFLLAIGRWLRRHEGR
jgi:uncharacterized membrane protein YkvA (DUF1232 family)